MKILKLNTMIVRLISDVHLEFRDKSIVNLVTRPKSSETLVIAGDLCCISFPKKLRRFLKSCSIIFKYVIYVPGNHEYYTHNLEIYEIDEKIQKLIMDLDNVHFLNLGKSIVLDDVEFIGTTLWSIPPEKGSISDLRNIKYLNKEVYGELHEIHRMFLEKSLKCERKAKKRVVVTHHLPTKNLIGSMFQNDKLNEFFYSNCEDLINLLHPSDLWLCGHSHQRASYFGDNFVQCELNPVGYPRELTYYDPNLYINL